MKYTMLFAALWWPYLLAAQTAYNFIASTGAWTDASSWSPLRSNPKADDLLLFAANAVVTGMPDSETISGLNIQNNAQILLSSDTTSSLIITNSVLSTSHFNVSVGSSIEFAGSGDIHLLLSPGTKGVVNGKISVTGAPHRIEVSDSIALSFEPGSSFIAASGFTGNAFGTTNFNSVVFKNGSAYYSRDGGNPFGAMAPRSVVIFESGSFYYQQQAIGLSLGGRTYGNLQTEANINLSLFGSVNDVTIQNDLIVSQGYFIFHPNTLHAGNFKIFGNIVQRGSSILDIGNGNMAGAVQMLGNNPDIGAGNGSGACSFQNLHLNCTGAASAQKNIEVKGTLGLIKGILVTDSNKLLTLAAGAKIFSPVNAYGHLNEGWEQSFIDGPLQLIITSTEKITAPVGDEGVFAPLMVEKANGNPATYVVQYFHQQHGDVYSVNSPPLDHVSQVEYWQLSSNDVGNDAKLSFSWRPGSFVGETVAERNDLVIAHYADFGSGVVWDQEGNQASILGNASYGYLGSDNYITNLSTFTLASRSRFNALPIHDIHFSGRELDGIVELKWSAGAGNNSYLERRQSTGGNYFLKLIPPGIGLWHDTLPESGEFYYRLLLSTQTGASVSRVVRINFSADHVFSLYPNPCQNILFINFSTQSSTRTIELVNSQGQFLQTLALTGNAVNTTWLNKGKYYIRFRVKNKVVTKAFLRL